MRLSHRLPYAAEGVLAHLALTAVPGVEHFDLDTMTYRRTLRLPHGPGLAALTPRADHVECALRLDDLRDLPAAVARCRWLFDLDADPVAVDAALASDPVLAPLVAPRTPAGGCRAPPTGPSWRCAPCSASRCRRAPPDGHTARLVAGAGRAARPTRRGPDPPVPHPGGDRRGRRRGAAGSGPPGPNGAHAWPRRWPQGELVLEPDADRARPGRRLEAIPGVGPVDQCHRRHAGAG